MVGRFVSAKLRPRTTAARKSQSSQSSARLFAFPGATIERSTMHTALRSSIGYQRALIRAGLRMPVKAGRRWTGRARVSAATNTVIPKCVTTTTHRTRVSEMRSSVSRVNCDLLVKFAPRRSNSSAGIRDYHGIERIIHSDRS